MVIWDNSDLDESVSEDEETLYAHVKTPVYSLTARSDETSSSRSDSESEVSYSELKSLCDQATEQCLELLEDKQKMCKKLGAYKKETCELK